MIKKFLDTINKYNLIEYGDSIVVGFSGGADSICLLYLLNEIKEQYNLKIITAHLNHGVRGEEAKRDQEFCRDISKNLGLKFETKNVSMNDYARENGLSKEAAGRELRYEFFYEVMKKNGANKIALAHNYNDQVETVLMRIFRGTGIDGLSGMDYKNGVLIRPILDIERAEIVEYLSDMNIAHVEDSTNAENDYQRNKIRNLLLPELRKYNPNIDASINNLSRLASIDSKFLMKLSEDAFLDVSRISDDEIELDIEKLKKYDLSIQTRVIRRSFYKLTGEIKDISMENILAIINLMDLESGKYINNISGLSIRNSYGKIIFCSNQKNGADHIYMKLKLGINKINEDLSINVEYTDRYFKSSDISICLPSEIVNGDLVIRNRQDGDKIRPFGLNGTKKLKDVFIDKKIDRSKRDSYLVLSDSKNLYWVIDLITSEHIGYKSETDKYLKITLIK